MKIIRAWEAGKNTIRYVYKNEAGKKVFGEEHFDWFFYVKTEHFEKFKNFFTTLETRAIVKKYENDGLYTKVFVDRSHASEFLDKNCDFVWEFKDFNLNKIIALLNDRQIPHFEADVPPSKRWILTNGIEFEPDLRVLYLDLETDDKNMKGQPIPGEFQILSASLKDERTEKLVHLCCEQYGDEYELPFLEKLLKIINAYDVVAAWNGGQFDFLYLKNRCIKFGLQLDWRKIILQDHLEIFKKHGQKLQSYSLDFVSKTIVGRGKVDHGMKIFQLFDTNKEMLEKYNNEDVQLMFDIEKKTMYLATDRRINHIGMCPADDRFITRKIDMMLMKQLMEDKHYHFKTKVRKSEEELKSEEFEGAYVHDTTPGRYKRVYIIDASSMYPNTIKRYNISPDTLIEPNEEYPAEHTITSPSGAKFKRDIIGVVPKVIFQMSEFRNKYKKLKNTVSPDSEEYKTYDCLQYAFKSFGLSFYGAMGEKNSRFFDVRIAEAVTKGGRFLTTSCIDRINEMGHKVIGGDTDSVFIVPKDDSFDVNALLKYINDYSVNIGANMNPINHGVEFAYDKGFITFLTTTKKRYVGYLDYLEGKVLNPPKMIVKGLEFVRTDVCTFLKNKQKELFEMLLCEPMKQLGEIRKFIDSCKQYIIKGDVKIEDIMFGKKLTKAEGDYKAETMHLKVVSEMRQDNKEIYIGDKILYFIEDVDSEGKGVPRPVYKYNNKFARVYYWNKVIYPALKRVLKVAFNSVNWDSYEIASLGKKKEQFIGRTDLWD